MLKHRQFRGESKTSPKTRQCQFLSYISLKQNGTEHVTGKNFVCPNQILNLDKHDIKRP